MGNRIIGQRPQPELLYYNNDVTQHRQPFGARIRRSNGIKMGMPIYRRCLKHYHLGEQFYSLLLDNANLPVVVMIIINSDIIIVNQPSFQYCSCGRYICPRLVRLAGEYRMQYHEPIFWTVIPTTNIYPAQLSMEFVYLLDVPNFGQIFCMDSGRRIAFNRNINVVIPNFNTWSQTFKLDTGEIIGCFSNWKRELILVKSTGEILECTYMVDYKENTPRRYYFGSEEENITITEDFESATYFRKQQTGMFTKPTLQF